MNLAKTISISLLLLLTSASASAREVDGYWLDQYNLILYLATLRLDTELKAISHGGSAHVMVHADSLPDPILRWVAWRSRLAGLTPVAWIQRPTVTNLKRVGNVEGFSALQIDDHFFTRPPVPINKLKAQIGNKDLWCSFQPRQYSWSSAMQCDHVDIQLYRADCNATINHVYALGVAGNRNTAIAVYHDGSPADDLKLSCLAKRIRALGNRVFVFKWKNQEHWLSPITRRVWRIISKPI